MTGTWLLVFWGSADWPRVVAGAIDAVAPVHDQAHHVLAAEHDGTRWSLLLVHWTVAERARLMERLAGHWEDVFVNRMDDLGDLGSPSGLVEPVPRPEWSPLPGGTNVDGKVLYRRNGVVLAVLRFGPNAGFPAHAADHAADVFCIEGRGVVSIGGESAAIQAGEWSHWPAGVEHRLWTDEHPMTTLMFERY